MHHSWAAGGLTSSLTQEVLIEAPIYLHCKYQGLKRDYKVLNMTEMKGCFI